MTERYAHMCRDEHTRIGHNDSSEDRCPLCRAIDALSAIESLTADEIQARFGHSSSKTADEVGQKFTVYHLLVLPRDIARNALKALRVAPMAELDPHAYVPSAAHQGDCAVCGHLQGAAIHSPFRRT